MKPTSKPVRRKMWLAIILIPQAVQDRLALVQILRRKVRHRAINRPERRPVHRPASLPHQQRLVNSRNLLILAILGV